MTDGKGRDAAVGGGVGSGVAGVGVDRDASPLAVALLGDLLDRYERSAAFQSAAEQHRRIQVKLTDREIAGYQSGGMDADDRSALHETLKRWAGAGIVALRWAPYEEGNLLERVLLEWKGIPDAYGLLGRMPRADRLEQVEELLREWEPRLQFPWMQRWLADVRESMAERRAIPRRLLPEDAQEQGLLLQSLTGLVDKGDEALPVRLFSKRYLRGSKVFEQRVRSRFVRLLREYAAGTDGRDWADIAEEDGVVLAEAGILEAHEVVEFCGPLVLRARDGATLDCGRFPLGLGLDTHALAELEVVEVGAARVLSIENKTNYHQYVLHERRPDELVVYLGGFPSPAKRRFLARMARAVDGRGAGGVEGREREVERGDLAAGRSSVEWLHWGDIDYGGILIAQTLADGVWPQVRPWRMEPDRLEEFAQYLEPYSPGYRARLEALLGRPGLEGWRPLVEKLLEVGATLEQEAFLV